MTVDQKHLRDSASKSLDAVHPPTLERQRQKRRNRGGRQSDTLPTFQPSESALTEENLNRMQDGKALRKFRCIKPLARNRADANVSGVPYYNTMDEDDCAHGLVTYDKIVRVRLVRGDWLLAANGFWLPTRMNGELVFEEIPTYFRGALQETDDEPFIEVSFPAKMEDGKMFPVDYNAQFVEKIGVPPPKPPQMIEVQCGEKPELNGHYSITSRPINGMPIWACDKRRLYRTAAKTWGITDHPDKVMKNMCFIKSIDHSKVMPQDVEEWEFWDGQEWVASETDVGIFGDPVARTPFLSRVMLAYARSQQKAEKKRRKKLLAAEANRERDVFLTKFFHNLPTRTLRTAFRADGSTDFEELGGTAERDVTVGLADPNLQRQISVVLSREGSEPWGFVWDAALKAAGFRVLRGVDPDTPLDAWNKEQAHLVEHGKTDWKQDR